MWCGNDNIFKTYVQGNPSGDGKKPIEKVKDRDRISTFEEVQDCSCFGGILNDGIVDISFDTKEMYEAFLSMAEENQWRCLCLPSTKGGHTYWRNSRRIRKGGRDKKLAVGLVADIHDKGTYIPLRVHGADRFPPDYDILPGEVYQEVPEELLPLNTNINLWGMTTGDGRNNDLYGYILVLQSQLSLSQEQISQVIYNSNRFILSEPLPPEELEVILRDEAFQKPSFFVGNTFLFDKFAAYIRDNCHVFSVNSQLHIFRNGVYVNGYRKIESEMIRLIPNLKKTQRREVLDYMELIAEERQQSDARYIAFNNGVYDLTMDELVPFNTDMVITNKIPWDYRPDAYNELTDLTLNKLACGDEAIRQLLEECIGYCFYRRNELGKAFILTGDKSNGKSTFLDMVKEILGDGNISALDLKELGDRFSTSMMFGKLANIGDDIGDDFLQGSQVATFKKVVTGNRIKAERKGQDPFEFNPYVKLLFSANDIPRMKDKTGAVLRRLVIIPFNATFSKDDPDYDPYIKYKLIDRESIEYLIRLGVAGLHRVKLNNEFTKSEQVQTQMKEYEEENNPIVAFIADQGEEMIENQPTKEVFLRYQIFCQENNMTPMSNIVFSKHINKRLNFQAVQKKINGAKYRIFTKIPKGESYEENNCSAASGSSDGDLI